MRAAHIQQLYKEELITAEEYAALKEQLKQPVSLYADLHTLLYAGIILFSTGISIIIYKNIDSIGHGVIVAIIALLCISCFIFCFKKTPGFSANKQISTNTFADYILLLGCLLLLTLTVYLQFQFNVFGNRLGMATFIPMVLLFLAAYYFDHIGVLSMAVTNLAAWAGIAVAPLNIMRDNDFSNPHLIYAGIVLGVGLFIIALLSEKYNFKAHFSYTYRNFSIHLLFISLLAGMFYYETLYLIWFAFILAPTFFMWRYALSKKSFYFLVVTVLYSYIAFCYIIFRLIPVFNNTGAFYLYIIWFIVSGIALIRLLIYYNKVLNQHA
ncbi:MAG: DUF2157 domain-containing protein [Parafilimonas sp.]